MAERKGTEVYVVVGKYGPETTEVMAFNERFELDARTEFPTKKLSIVLPKEVPLDKFSTSPDVFPHGIIYRHRYQYGNLHFDWLLPS